MRALLTALLLLPTALPASGIDPADLLHPEEAFHYQVSDDGAGTLRVTWEIADGYYLYRSKLSFASLDDAVVLGEPRFPAGEVKTDQFFGEQEVYRGTVVVELPYRTLPPAPARFTLELRSQGCADLGLCYPPQRWQQDVDLGAAAPAPGFLDQLAAVGGQLGGDAVLPPEQAFVPTVRALDGNSIVLRWDIAAGYYLYRDQLAARSLDPAVALGLPRFPAGVEQTDVYFGTTVVYYDSVEIPIMLTRSDAAAREIEVELEYQGCKEDSICYPPSLQLVSLHLPAADGSAAAPDPVEGRGLRSEQDRLADTILSGGLLAMVLLFFGFGLLLAFTPCILPMIPILSGIIVGRGEQLSTGRATLLSTIYVLSMALAYTAAGVIAALLGQNLQATFQDPWVLSGFSLVFVALALSMFGFYELQLPAGLQAKLTELSNRQRGGELLGVAIMGVLSALIVGPCVAPPLTAALIVIGQSGDPLRGGLALFSLSMGLGAPLIVVGASAGRLLPRAGAWMDGVKVVFGLLMLAVAIWLMARVLPGPVTLALWGALALGAGLQFGALDQRPEGAPRLYPLRRTIAIILALYGAVAVAGSLAGGSDPLRPGAALSGEPQPEHALPFVRVKSVADLEREVAAATAAGRPVMFDFYADWCVSCLEMEAFTFSDPQVQAALEAGDTVLLQADVTANDELDQALLRRFGIFGPPTIVFWDRRGRQLEHLRVVGYMPADEFLQVVREASR